MRPPITLVGNEPVLPGMDAIHCGACRHYQGVTDAQGECRKNPPNTYVVPVQTIQGQGIGFSLGQWPAVHAAQGWCGEFVENM